MNYNFAQFENKRRPGGRPVWIAKHPALFRLMEETGLRQYDIALICNMHPDSLGKKLRTTMTLEEEGEIIDAVRAYLKAHPQEGTNNGSMEE